MSHTPDAKLSPLRLLRRRLAAGLSLCVLFAHGQAQAPPVDARELPPGQTLEREATAAATHAYKLTLRAGEFLQVCVEQKGIDVALALADEAGTTLATTNTPNGKNGPETLSFVARRAGRFVLSVSVPDAKAEKGAYTIRREAARTATAKDERRAAVERLFAAGMEAQNTQGQNAEARADAALPKLEEALAGWRELGDEYLIELTARQIREIKVQKHSASILGELHREFGKGQAVLGEGQTLMAKSQADSLAARAKLNEALTLFRALNVKLADKALLDRVSQTGEAAPQVLTNLNFIKFSSQLHEALALNGIAQTHFNLKEWRESIDFLKLALSAYQAILDDEVFITGGDLFKRDMLTIRGVVASVHGDLGGKIDAHLGDKEESIRFLSGALVRYRALYRDTQDARFKLKEALTLKKMGQVYARESKDYAKAIESYRESLEVYRLFTDRRKDEADVLEFIAASQFANFDYRAARENYDEALKLYREIDDKAGQSSILQSLGLMHWTLNDKPRVLEIVKQTLAILQSPDFVENWKRHVYRGGAGVFDEIYAADIEYKRLDRIAFAYGLAEDYPRAIEFYEKSLAAARARQDHGSVRLAHFSLGQAHSKLGKWDKAAENFRLMLAISRDQGVAEDVASDLQEVGWALLELGSYGEALEHQHEALLTYKSAGVDENSAFNPAFSALLVDLSRTHHALGNRRLAILYGKRSVNALQGERHRVQNLDEAARKGFFERKEDHYRRVANWLIEEGRLLEAEQVLRMLKEEEVISYLRRDASEVERLRQRADLTADEKDALSRYNEIADGIAAAGVEFGQLQELQKKQALTEEQKKRFDELSLKTRDANRAFGAFLKQLADEFTARPNVKTDLQENLALKSDLKQWGEGVVFLYTLVGEDRYRVILTTPRAQADGKTEIKAAELNEKIVRFREAVQNPAADPRPLGKELYDILIRPVEKQLEGAKAKTLLWSLDGGLRLLPLAALWDGRQYFGQKYQNVTITLASRTRIGSTPAQGWRVLGAGVTQSRTVTEPDGTREVSFSALPAVRSELAAIVRSDKSPDGVMPGSLLLDAEFNSARLRSELLKGYKVVHIASHFSLNPGDATRSFLLLGDGTALTVSEIKTSEEFTFDGVELLTLSACQTALVEKDATGREVEGLGYVAQVKGAKAILATLWNVADESTQLLMSEFYRLRDEDPLLTKAAALQLAQRAMLEGKLRPAAGPKTNPLAIAQPSAGAQKKSYAHPYYWSPFVLIGNWR